MYSAIIRPYVKGGANPVHPYLVPECKGDKFHFQTIWECSGFGYNHVNVGDYIRCFADKYSYWSEVVRVGHTQSVSSPWIETQRIDYPYPRNNWGHYIVPPTSINYYFK